MHRNVTLRFASLIIGITAFCAAGSAMLVSQPAQPVYAASNPAASTPKPTATPKGYQCPTSSTNRYVQGSVEQWDTINPVRIAKDDPEKNLALRSYGLVEGEHGTVTYGPTDENSPPQFASIFNPDRMPIFLNLYRVNSWDWANNKRGGPEPAWPVSALGLETIPGEWIQPPWHSYHIGEPGGVGGAIVLFADADSVTLAVSRADSASWGYVVHIDGLCTDPNLLALYTQLDTGNRYVWTGTPKDTRPDYDLPIVRATDVLGTARGREVIVAVRDTGEFMDPRTEADWWEIKPPYVTPKPSLFSDVPVAGKEWMQPWIETAYHAGIAFGCDGGQITYCPDKSIKRGEMMVYLLSAMHYAQRPYTPTDLDDHYADVPAPGKAWMQPWIEEAYDLNISKGCGRDTMGALIFCPDRPVTNTELAYFALRTKHGWNYKPPKPTTPIFADVPDTWLRAWIEQFYREGITAGCGQDANKKPLFCPTKEVTRAEMAIYVLKAFEGLPKPK